MAENSKDRWWLPLIVGLIAFLGAGLGAVLPRWYFESEETQRRLIEARINAYNDFFKGQARLQEGTELPEQGKGSEAGQVKDSSAAPHTQEKTSAAPKVQDNNSVMITDARFRVATYGNKSELEALEKYYRQYLPVPPCKGTRQKWLDDIRTYQEIRNGIFEGDSRQKIDDAKLILLLFNCHIPA